MSIATYDECLRRLLVHEGGYSNHPQDPGGPTNFGITLADYRRYVKPNATALDVRNMKVAEAKEIYRAKYWNAEHGDDLPAGVDDCIFDYGVNSGIGRSGKVLRQVVGLPTNTSAVTPDVIAAVARKNPTALVNAICDERLRFLKSLHTWPTFGPGWQRRVTEVRAFSVALAARQERPINTLAPATPPSQSAGKGTLAPPPTKPIIVGAGIPATAGAGSLAHWMSSHELVTGAAIVGACVVVAGVVYLLEQRHTRRTETPMPDTHEVPDAVAA